MSELSACLQSQFTKQVVRDGKPEYYSTTISISRIKGESQVIDWMTIDAPLKTQPTKLVRTIDLKTGETREFPQRIKLGGKNKATQLRISVVGHGTRIIVSGNPIKYLTGQNVVGNTDVMALGYRFLREVCRQLRLRPSASEIKAWKRGEYWLTRIDIAGYFRLISKNRKKLLIKMLRCHMGARKLDMHAQAFDCVAVIRKGRKKISVYDKVHQTNGFRDLPSFLANSVRLRKFLDRALRAEVQFFSTELARMGLTRPDAWRQVSIRHLLLSELRKAGFRAKIKLPAVYKAGTMTRRQFVELSAWRAGTDILEGLSRAVRYSRIKEFAALGHDVRQAYSGPNESRVDLAQVFSKGRLVTGTPRWLRPLSTSLERILDASST